MKLRQITVPINAVLPGQNFSYLGQRYRRALKEQVAGHPAQELVRQREPGSLVLAYSLIFKKDDKVIRTPVSIATKIGEAITMVWIRGDLS